MRLSEIQFEGFQRSERDDKRRASSWDDSKSCEI